jgi:hypothetical protein
MSEGQMALKAIATADGILALAVEIRALTTVLSLIALP